MKVYKFGGASVKDASGVRNVERIVRMAINDPMVHGLMVVVSAMGKTTNALERVVDYLAEGHEDKALAQWVDVFDYHVAIMRELGLQPGVDIRLQGEIPYDPTLPYDENYDQVVSTGELLSSQIIAVYLLKQGLSVEWWNIPKLLRTDATWREAKVDDETSRAAITAGWNRPNRPQVVVTQGFIGGTADGKRTTLGREGSDYTAALLGNYLDAESHPKSIRPLENKHIPLLVKPFGDPQAAGSRIADDGVGPIGVPVYIWRKNQILITMRAKDFAFVLEESLSEIFDIIHRHRLKVSLIQSSAVTISVCVDNTRFVPAAIEALQEHFSVSYNDHLSLLTIRGTTPEILERAKAGRTIMLSQTTRRTARLVVKESDI